MVKVVYVKVLFNEGSYTEGYSIILHHDEFTVDDLKHQIHKFFDEREKKLLENAKIVKKGDTLFINFDDVVVDKLWEHLVNSEYNEFIRGLVLELEPNTKIVYLYWVESVDYVGMTKLMLYLHKLFKEFHTEYYPSLVQGIYNNKPFNELIDYLKSLGWEVVELNVVDVHWIDSITNIIMRNEKLKEKYFPSKC